MIDIFDSNLNTVPTRNPRIFTPSTPSSIDHSHANKPANNMCKMMANCPLGKDIRDKKYVNMVSRHICVSSNGFFFTSFFPYYLITHNYAMCREWAQCRCRHRVAAHFYHHQPRCIASRASRFFFLLWISPTIVVYGQLRTTTVTSAPCNVCTFSSFHFIISKWDAPP